MPVDVRWLYKDRVIEIRQHGRVSSQQIVAALEESRQMIRQGKPPVHTIVDGRDADGTPDIALGDLRKLIPSVIEGSGWVIAIQDRAIDRFFTSLGSQIAGAKYKFAPDEKGALALLKEQDPTLIDVIG